MRLSFAIGDRSTAAEYASMFSPPIHVCVAIQAPCGAVLPELGSMDGAHVACLTHGRQQAALRW